MAPTADGAGYWILNAVTGVISPYGDAVMYGQPADTPAYSAGADLRPDAIAMVATTDGKGYWVLEKGLSGLGSVQAFGDAVNFGDETTIAHPAGHVGTPVAMAATSDDGGYWIVDSDGGVFSFGDAIYAGSMGGKALAAPVVGIAAGPHGAGYWLAGADGGVFSSGTPPSAARRPAPFWPHRWWASPPLPAVGATGWPRRTGGSSLSAERRSSGRWGATDSTVPSSPSALFRHP